jgi:hypothetical protein
MRPGDVPNLVIADLTTTVTSGRITGFAWIVLAFAVGGLLVWLWKRSW